MSRAGDICWKRFFAGRNPSQLVVVGSRVVCSYIADQRDAGSPGRHRVVCLDLEGQERWSARDFELEVALPDDRLLGVTRSGTLRTLTVDGRKADGVHDGMKRVRVKEVVEVRKSSQHLLLATNEELIVTDIALNVVGRFSAPLDGRGVFVGDRVLAAKGNEIVQWDRRGRADTLCQIPIAMAYEAMTRWEEDTGTPALHGLWEATFDPGADLATGLRAALDKPSRTKFFGIGDRLRQFVWTLSYVEELSAVFVSNATHPHVLLCLGLDGVPRWSTYLSSGCCGGAPVQLPSGELVVSSGCGGIVTWLDPSGRVTRRTRPHDGTGLAVIYSPHARVLSDSSCIVEGGPGIVSYGPDGSLRWHREDIASCFDYDERLGLLVTAAWTDYRGKAISVACIKNLTPRVRA